MKTLARAFDVGFGFAAMWHPSGLDRTFQQRDFVGGLVEQGVDDLGFGFGDFGRQAGDSARGISVLHTFFTAQNAFWERAFF